MKIILFLGMLIYCVSSYGQVDFNGSFEHLDSLGKPTGWDFTFNNNNTYNVIIDSNIKSQGRYSVKISSGNHKIAASAIRFPFNQKYYGNTLTMTGSIKINNVTDGFAGLWIRVDGKDGKVLAFDNMESQGVRGSTGWKDYYVQVKYDNSEAVKIEVGALLVGKGDVWIDNLALYVDTCHISESKVKIENPYPAEKDSIFNNGSKIDTIISNSKNLKYLTLLGQLWGFLKYHHPTITSGNINWDTELFKFMPQIIDCKSDSIASALFESWVDKLGKPPVCSTCKDIDSLKIAVVPNYGTLFSNQVFTKQLVEKLRYILKNRNHLEGYYAKDSDSYPTAPSYFRENGYINMLYPDVGYRLLALYRYWNIIQYFYPHRYLIEEGWSNILKSSITEFITAKNRIAYLSAVSKLVASIHDTHASNMILADEVENLNGPYQLPVKTAFIDGKVVITKPYFPNQSKLQDLKIGDVIVSINGQSLHALINKFSPYVSASNRAAKMRDLQTSYLLRSKLNSFSLRIIRGGATKIIKYVGVGASLLKSYEINWGPDPLIPAFKILRGKIGYIYPAKFTRADLEVFSKEITKINGIIIDFRCYPVDQKAMIELSNMLKISPSPYLKYSFVKSGYPGMFYYSSPLLNGGSPLHFKGKVIVIVNSMTQSSAEFATMALQSSANVKVIGSMTAGADGGVTEITLPGKLKTNISDVGIFYPDGGVTQRKGIKIDYLVKPSLKGIKAGRDELLEKAKRLIDNPAWNSR